VAGYLEFGLAQSDIQYQAVKGLAGWAKQGPLEQLRAVFSMHHESLCLVAAVDAGINAITDLKGKKVNLGNPGSGQYRNAIDALLALGLKPKTDIDAQKARAAEAPVLLQDNRIDAFFCTVGHPSETLQNATTGERKVRFVPITGSGIDQLVADHNYYTKTTVPVAQFYPSAENPAKTETFGVIATLCTSAKVPDHVVYGITKAVFENFDYFKRQHPALRDLAKEDMLKGLTAPFHAGALKYFKEVGLLR
jgi:TRAP transporter TAXI family solute receptor